MSEWVPSFELRHIGINHKDEPAARNCAEKLSALFDLGMKDMPTSIFTGSLFEVMKYQGPGTLGHIAIAVDSIERAKEYLAAKGQGFKEETARYNDDGQLTFLYLDGDFSGFAIHLSRK